MLYVVLGLLLAAPVLSAPRDSASIHALLQTTDPIPLAPWSYMSEATDGTCRDQNSGYGTASTSDPENYHYHLFAPGSESDASQQTTLAECQAACEAYTDKTCLAIEWRDLSPHIGRCELWTELPSSVVVSPQTHCWRRNPHTPTAPWHYVTDLTQDGVCKIPSGGGVDNLASPTNYDFVVYKQGSATDATKRATFEDCKDACISKTGAPCLAMGYRDRGTSQGRCELWETLPTTTEATAGAMCWKHEYSGPTGIWSYIKDDSVDGACKTSTNDYGVPSSANAANFDYHLFAAGSSTDTSQQTQLHECQNACLAYNSPLPCVAMEWRDLPPHVGRCELWVKPPNHATASAQIHCWKRGALSGASFMGDNRFHQLGANTVSQDVSEPINLPGISQVAIGTMHTLAIKGSQVFGSGNNNFGQLGFGPTTRSMIQFVEIPEFAQISIKKIVAGGEHSLVIDTTGNVYVFGNNHYGQLGLAEAGGKVHTPRLLTKSDGSALTGVKDACAGWGHTLIRGQNNELFVTGRNADGELGLDHHSNVQTLTSHPSLTNYVDQIACGAKHSIILRKTPHSDMIAFGDNAHGQLCVGDRIDRKVATTVTTNGFAPKGVCAGAYHTIVRHSGGVMGCGMNYYGQLGVSTGQPTDDVRDRTQFVAVNGFTTEVDQVACGQYHTLFSLNGEVWGTGRNYNGQLGLGTDNKDDQLLPVKLAHDYPNLQSIHAGGGVSAIITES